MILVDLTTPAAICLSSSQISLIHQARSLDWANNWIDGVRDVNNQIRVLAVDDHPLLREGIAVVIQGERDIVLIDQASNGQEAIEKFRTHRPDVTLMDLQMPGMNGIDTMIAIRREFSHARFIVLTTYDGDVQALRAL